MSVIRVDLNQCIGCRKCVIICPMDVFYFDEEARKSVLAYHLPSARNMTWRQQSNSRW